VLYNAPGSLLDFRFGTEYVWLWVCLVTNFFNLSKHLEAGRIYWLWKICQIAEQPTHSFKS